MSDRTEATIIEIRSAMQNNIRRLENALSEHPFGYVHVWPQYWIGVKVNKDVCHGVAVDLATITHKRDTRVFTNGNKQQTILMNRSDALHQALQHARNCLSDFDRSLAERAA